MALASVGCGRLEMPRSSFRSPHLCVSKMHPHDGCQTRSDHLAPLAAQRSVKIFPEEYDGHVTLDPCRMSKFGA
uniref:Uncharacterized protein n=1 Tax=Coccidioides posadasii RMSCC 3488 TaxID=454284 RepID=A0A0J6F3Y2_COCPO|nr:hypothetical protein CPAG_01215 [Coccidioides posadasii RMSCC 3488]